MVRGKAFSNLRIGLSIGRSKVTVMPKFGGIIGNLVLNGVSVLDCPKTLAELQENPRRKNAILFPFPNRLRDGAYQFGGRKYKLPLNHAKQGHAIHGLVYDEPFVVKKVVRTGNRAAVTVGYEYPGNPGYPFAFQILVTYTLRLHSLEVKFEASNVGSRVLPFGVGFHPYFRVGKVDFCYLQLEKAEKLVCDNRQIPTGKTTPGGFQKLKQLRGIQLDDCFLTRKAVLHTPRGILTVKANKEWPYFQIYTPADRMSIAIEPQTCAPNAFNNKLGLKTLRPGATWSGKFSIELR